MSFIKNYSILMVLMIIQIHGFSQQYDFFDKIVLDYSLSVLKTNDIDSVKVFSINSESKKVEINSYYFTYTYTDIKVKKVKLIKLLDGSLEKNVKNFVFNNYNQLDSVSSFGIADGTYIVKLRDKKIIEYTMGRRHVITEYFNNYSDTIVTEYNYLNDFIDTVFVCYHGCPNSEIHLMSEIETYYLEYYPADSLLKAK